MRDEGWRTFFVFKSLDNNMIYSSSNRFICIQKESLQKKSLMRFKIWLSWDPRDKKLKSQVSVVFFTF